MSNFTLYHTTLYAKGWYKRENRRTIWEDLKIILTLDGYNGEFMSNSDIVHVVLSQCGRLKIRAFTDLTEFAAGISPAGSWKYGYPTKGNYPFVGKEDKFPEYDYSEAIIRYCLSNLSCATKAEIAPSGKLPRPDYVNGLPRKNGISDKRLNELFV